MYIHVCMYKNKTHFLNVQQIAFNLFQILKHVLSCPVFLWRIQFDPPYDLRIAADVLL